MKYEVRYSKSEKTRQFIIEKAAILFNTKGYVGTSMADITAVTGLTKGSVYGNFANKDEVAIEAFKYNLVRIGTIFQAGVSAGETPLDKLLRLPETYREIYAVILQIGGCPILNTASEADDMHPTLKQLAQQAVKRLTATIARIIIEGIQQQQLRPDAEPEKVASLIFVLMEGGFLISKLNENSCFFENALEQVKKMIDDLKV